jgi:nucleoside-diphosphate-sugar epimerase
MPRRKPTIAVTGAAGYLAGRLIEVLTSSDRVGKVLGFDVRPTTFAHPKFLFDHLDVRNPAFEARLRGVDVLVHLAFIMDPIHDEALMRDVNVAGSQNIFYSAHRAGVPKVVYTSSATVYGAHPNNDLPLTEESPLRANLDFSYPAHKLEVEYVIKECREEFPEMKFVVLRPAIVFGPNVDNAWSHFLEFPVFFSVRGYSPVWQFVHEEDVGRALEFAVFEDLDGEYNLGPADWVSTDDSLALLGRRRVELSEPRAFAVLERLWRLGLSEAPAGMLHYVMHPWVVSPEKLESAGFACRHSSADSFALVAEQARAYIRLGRTRMRRADVVRGAAAGAGILGAAAALRRVRRQSA